MWVSIHPGVSLYESRPVEWRGSASSHGRSVGRSVVGHSTARAGGATTGTIESMALEALEEEEEDVFVVKDARGRVYGAVVNDGEDDAFFNARGAFDAVTTADAREALARACERLVRDGQAWWSPTDVPRCALEAFARAVWEKYSSAATGVDVDASGVEFWARESAAGLHWDKDEELRERYGVWVTPHLATVTYVEVEDADGAAPTVVFEGLTPRSRPDAEDAREDENACERVTVMYPREWAHFTFDGRFLHGALDAFAKKPRDDDGARGRRVALLANVWFNHKPLGVERLPESYVEENFCDVAFDDDAKEMTIHRIARSDFGARRLGKCSVFGPTSSEYALANAELPLDALRAIALDDEDGPVNLFHITCGEEPIRVEEGTSDEGPSKRAKT